MAGLRYSETVPASLPADLLLGGAALLLLVLSGVLIAGGEALAAAGALVAAVALFAAFRSFRRLHLELDDEELRARFGNFRQRIALDDVLACRARRYEWLPYLGWGVRFGLSRRRAYSVPFRMSGVEVELASARWYVSSLRADELAAALERAIDDRRSAG